MKYINNGVGLNIIKDSDINLSESFENRNLSDVLSEYKKDLNTLKSNVKWLAKYGGVGGSGSGSGGSSSDVKLKYKVDILYVNDLGTLNTALLVFKSTNNNIIAKPASRATIVVTLLRAAPGVLYYATITYGTNTETLLINLATFLVSKTITCTGNSLLTVTVFATPEDRPETSAYIYTVVKDSELTLKLASGTTIPNGSTVLQSLASNEETKLYGVLTNYLPLLFSGSIKNLQVNGIDVPINCTNSDGVSGEIMSKFEISATSIFNSYGIYEVVMTYEYNNLEETVKNVYVYKDEGVFVYCYGETNTVYTQQQSNPNTSNFNLETIKFRIYPNTKHASNQAYSIYYSIEYEGKPEESTLSETLFKESNTDWEIKFSNIYTKDDFTESSLYKLITITFVVDGKSFVYYLYVRQVSELEYIFKHNYKNDRGADVEELFYNAQHSCTATIHEDFNPNTTFPFSNGLFNKLSSDARHVINRITNKTSLHNEVTSVYGSIRGLTILNGYVTNYKAAEDGTDADVLLSFGLKYYENNGDLPILTVEIQSGQYIKLYSNKIEYTNQQIYNRWQIPNDNNYHLIQIYYKPRYTIDAHSCINAAPNYTSSFICCIDGIFETAPISISPTSTVVPFTERTSTIVYHPGNWEFNFIGVATFNAKPQPSQWLAYSEEFLNNISVLKYALDFDPIIPANYYLAYYKFTNLVDLPLIFDKSVYINLYSSSDDSNSSGVNFYKNLNKFIPVDMVTIGKLTDLPIYIIEPNPSVASDYDLDINNFLHKTYAGGYNENSQELPNVECLFKRVIIEGTTPLEYSMVNDTNYKFSVTYLGSSTLKYGVKNFEISAMPFIDDDNVSHPVVWTPDATKFLPELSFTLKADVVDSSHSNNVVIGKFVNDYMKESSFKDDIESLNIKTCLEGFPILLFMRDTVPITEGGTTANSQTIFLGIYSFNLGRKSHFNLGYKRLVQTECDDISVKNISQAFVLKNDDAIYYPYKYRVAEVLGNSIALYDYSLYDLLMLLHKMLGDFYNRNNAGENDTFSEDVLRPFIGLNKLIYKTFINNFDDYTSYTFLDNNELCGYYSPIKNKSGVFNVLLLNFNYTGAGRITVDESFYYKDASGIIKPVQDGLVLTEKTVENIKPYLTLGSNNLTVIGNPKYQFHLVCSSSGEPFEDSYYYVEELDLINAFNPTNDDYFDYDTMLRYYMVCMIFAMVDSVQKNLTLRCKNYEEGLSNTWLLGFYDMDTSFGVDNVGNPVDFKAFSDYILDSGHIVSDYFEEDSENADGSGFDTPSTFLFLAAKYLNILTGANDESVPLGTRTYENSDKTPLLKTPFNYWQTLRQEGGLLANIDRFFETYVDTHFSNVNPLIWNLNYLYKYFSATGTSSGDKDTELSKFNGTRRFSRKTWLLQRLEIIDVLFGIRNNHTIGNSNTLYICKLAASTTTADLQTFNTFIRNVPIATTMFPTFAKGITTKQIDATLTTYPKAPVVLQTANNMYQLYLANDKGKIENITGTITSSTDIGFYGTCNIKELNECGLFMLDTKHANNIINNTINKINIERGPASGGLSISLDLDSLTSVRTITVNPNGGNSKIYKCNNFTITAPEDAILEEVLIKYTNASGAISISSTKGILTIEKLIIDNCKCLLLKLSNVRINSLELTQCLSLSYVLSGHFPNLNLLDGTTTNFELNSISGGITAQISMGALKTLTIEGSIKEFKNSATSNSCESITVEALTPKDVTLHLANFVNFSNAININLTNLVENLKLYCYNNLKCLGYNIIQKSGLKSVGLLKNAFYNNYSIEYISLCKEESEIGQKDKTPLIGNVPLEVLGNNIFYNCKLLPAQFCIPTSQNQLELKSTESSYTYMYLNNLCITIDDVIKFFTYAKCDDTDVNLTGIFGQCSNIQFYPINNSNVYTPPVNYNAFLTAIGTFTLNKNVNFKYAFAETKFNYLDSELVNKFKSSQTYQSKHVVMLPDVCPTSEDSTGEIIYVTSDFLTKYASVEFIELGSRYSMNGKIFGETLVKVLKSTSNGLEIDTNVNLHDLLNNGCLAYIGCLNMYCDNTILVDCSNGFPNTIKCVEVFGNKIVSFAFKNLLLIFNNVTDCDVYVDRFFGSSTTDNSSKADSYKVNLFNLFWTEVDTKAVPKVRFKLFNTNTIQYSDKTSADTSVIIRGSNALDHSLNFLKTCTADQFKLIMQYLVDKQNEYLKSGEVPLDCMLYNQIPGLFSYCTINNVGTFENLIKANDGKSYFSLRYRIDEGTDNIIEVNFIGLERTFLNCVLKNGSGNDVAFDVSKMWDEVLIGEYLYKTKVINLMNTFQNTLQTKIENPLNIRWVRNMKRCFYNCRYNISENGAILNGNPAGSGFSVSWSWKKDFPILPAKFFEDFCNCNVTEAFASEGTNNNNIQGHLPYEDSMFWWLSGEVDVSSSNYLFTNALLHPVIRTEPLEEGGETISIDVYYLYPKTYTDNFGSLSGAYKHVMLPYNSSSDNSILYLFEDGETLLNLKERLPKLPDNLGSTYYDTFLSGGSWKVRINKSSKFMNNTAMMGGLDYVRIIPKSLFSVLNEFSFNTYNITGGPIIWDDGYGYSTAYPELTTITPGGIYVADLHENIKNYL